MLKRRLQGVLRQYGPIVAFLTTDVLLRNVPGINPIPAKQRESVGKPDPVLYTFLLRRLGSRRTDYVFHEDMLYADRDAILREEARVRARLAVVFQTFLERGDWYEWENTPLMSGDDLLEIFRDDAWREHVWPPVGRGADFFSTSTSDVVVPWIASLLNRHVKNGVPLVTTEDVMRLTRALPNIIDWANATHPDLMGMSVPLAVVVARDWHEEMKHAATGQAVRMGEIVHRFPDGWTFQKLGSRELLRAEGDSQGICVGQDGYVRAVERGEMSIYSLRDEKSVPHVTIEVERVSATLGGRDERWESLRQVKGRGNALIKSPLLCRRLAEAFDALHIQYKPSFSLVVSPDWNDCDDVMHASRSAHAGLRRPRRAENPVRTNWSDARHARLPNPRAKRARAAPRMPEGETTYMVPLRKGPLPARLYHVTLTKHLPAIRREGLVPMKTSNWRKGGSTGARYGQGEVFAFEKRLDALRWAANWDWSLEQTWGSGKIAIIELRNAFDDWELDTADPLQQAQAVGRWLKRRGAIGPEYIVSMNVFDSKLEQEYMAAQRRRMEGG